MFFTFSKYNSVLEDKVREMAFDKRYIETLGIMALLLAMLSNIASAYSVPPFQYELSPTYPDWPRVDSITPNPLMFPETGPISITCHVRNAPKDGVVYFKSADLSTPDFWAVPIDNAGYATLNLNCVGAGSNPLDITVYAPYPSIVHTVLSDSEVKEFDNPAGYVYWAGHGYIGWLDGAQVTSIPEFPSVAVPVAAILGMVVIFGRKKHNW
jgi:hypothetical protein